MPGRLPTIDIRPSGSKPRTLVLCFDGTTNVYDDTNTNVVKLFSLLERNNRDEQMVYYQPGVGTYAPPGIFLPVSIAMAKVLDQGIALYLDKHVMGGYEFLMKHYNDGDRICLFGFSRGAYTARALAGMLNKVGLLPPDNDEQIPFAYSMFKRNDPAGFKASEGFKKTFCRTVQIEFMGVWDTVSSVGVLWPRHLPFTASNTIVKRFRHAVSLDEHRAKFKQNVWHVHSQNEADARRDPDHGSPIVSKKTATVRSPVSTLRLPKAKKAAAKLSPIPEPDISVTAATPPTEKANLPKEEETDQQGTLWLSGPGQTDLRNFVSSAPSSPGIQDENQGGPNDESWHSREPTRVHGARPDSGVGLETEGQGGPVTNAELPTIKSEVSLATGITAGVNVSASIGAAGETTNEKKPSTGVISWLRSRMPKKASTQMSGAAEFEEVWEEQHSDDGRKESTTDILEVWFAGCHSDVGGGEELNTAKYALSNISLRWMVRQIILAQCGIHFNQAALREMDIPLPTLSFGRIDPNAVYSYEPDAAAVKEAREREENDALAPIHDALKNPLWWPLEFFPLIHSYQDEDGKWHRSFRLNLFRARHARKTLGVVKVHRSVQFRQQNSDYVPRAKLDGTIEYVD
ncbi:choline transport protein [Ceratobasidium sp. AG-Ba]|nr:choline transport protein [Ceratobasidium sp. AG-Ba]